MVGVELVADRASKAGFDPAKNVPGRVRMELEARGLFTRAVRDIIVLAPPLVISEAEVDRIVDVLRGGISAVLPERA
jgi:adenosylmethionine-8-amino-7-oxononanoate aminotransferase